VQALVGRLGFVAAHLQVLVLCGVLLAAFAVQVFGAEMPCPLCVLQRLAMMLCALGGAYVIRAAREGQLDGGEYTTGHGMSLLGAVLGAMISGRQVLLHALPGDPGYGGAVLGLHLYTWAFVVFGCVVASSAICLVFAEPWTRSPARVGRVSRAVLALLGAVIVLNAVSIFFQAGFHAALPEDPTRYRLLQDLGLGGG